MSLASKNNALAFRAPNGLFPSRAGTWGRGCCTQDKPTLFSILPSHWIWFFSLIVCLMHYGQNIVTVWANMTKRFSTAALRGPKMNLPFKWKYNWGNEPMNDGRLLKVLLSEQIIVVMNVTGPITEPRPCSYSQSGLQHCSPPWSRPSSQTESPPQSRPHRSLALAWQPMCPDTLRRQIFIGIKIYVKGLG